jgi:hypothetical protein
MRKCKSGSKGRKEEEREGRKERGEGKREGDRRKETEGFSSQHHKLFEFFWPSSQVTYP